MTIFRIESLVYGVEDLEAGARYYEDWGLQALERGARGAEFRLPSGQSILLRAAEPPAADRSATGPGRLTRAFAVDRSLDRASLRGPDLWLEAGEPVTDREVRRTRRIGVDYAGTWAARRLRFVVARHPAVSAQPPRLSRG